MSTTKAVANVIEGKLSMDNLPHCYRLQMLTITKHELTDKDRQGLVGVSSYYCEMQVVENIESLVE